MGFWNDFPNPTNRHRRSTGDVIDRFGSTNAERNAGSNDGSGGGRLWGKRPLQGHLPLGLQWFTGRGKKKVLSPFAKGLTEGADKFGSLLSNPGGFGANLAEAIAPRVAMESEAINRNTQGQLAEASGAAARAGSGGGFAQALQASIQQAGARDKATSLRTAQMDSATLVREDADRLMATYQMLLDWYKPKGRGGTANSVAKAQNRTNNNMAYAKAASEIVGMFASDERLKESIRPIRPVSWTWADNAVIAGKVPGTKETGLVAQDVEKVWPDAVVEHPAGYKMVDYKEVATRLAGVLTSCRRKVA